MSYISFFHIIIPGKTKDGKSAGIVYNEGEKDGEKKWNIDKKKRNDLFLKKSYSG
jgi:hypothetical protein